MSRSKKNDYRYPWREGNRFTLLIDASAFYATMLEAIEAATDYILLEMYLVESGHVVRQFVDGLTAAAQRGVRVYCLLDDFGAFGLGNADRARLIDAGVSLSFYNPFHLSRWFENLARDHRKLLVVDGYIAIVGGAGITDEFDPPEAPQNAWRETMVAVRGPAVGDWQQLFASLWQKQTRTATRLGELPPYAAGDMLGRVLVTGGMRQELKRALLKRIRDAERAVWIETAYFVPPWRFRRALARAARRGVDVRLVLPGPRTDHPGVRQSGRRYYQRLLASGVRIFEYQPRVLHAKTYLCDAWAAIGSSNLDRWNIRWNLEADQGIEDPRFADSVQQMLKVDMSQSIECSVKDWPHRGWWSRWRERWWGIVDYWLHRLGRGRRDGG